MNFHGLIGASKLVTMLYSLNASVNEILTFFTKPFNNNDVAKKWEIQKQITSCSAKFKKTEMSPDNTDIPLCNDHYITGNQEFIGKTRTLENITGNQEPQKN